MAHYRASVDSPRTAQDAFAYLSDFSNTREWDPGVVDARRVADGAIRIGSEFDVDVRFVGRRLTLRYRIVEFEPDRAVTLLSESALLRSRDRITFEAVEAGTRVTYDAELNLKGPASLADPLMAIGFKQVGDRALGGLRKALGAQGPEAGAGL